MRETERVIPTHILIEPINGACTSRCPMCAVHETDRPSHCMTLDELARILDRFAPYLPHQEYLSFTGLGESLLSPTICENVALARRKGFTGTGLFTNCTELTDARARDLLDAGLEMLGVAVDGVRAETHEAIRVGTSFEAVVANVHRFLELRDAGGYDCKVHVRFIRNRINAAEWPAYVEYWAPYIDPQRGDAMVCIDMHNFAGNVDDTDLRMEPAANEAPAVCPDVFERISIRSNGEVILCCGDVHGFFDLGNVLSQDPVDIFNGPVFRRYRSMMRQGRIRELEHCRDCTVYRVRSQRIVSAPASPAAGP